MSSSRLYYNDCYLSRFRASVTHSEGDAVYLDRTAFYPTSGGQPFDLGDIGGIAVLDVIEEEDRVRHVLASALPPGEYDCAIDWTRRFDHMQQHTGQHLLSAILFETFGYPTVSFHLGQETSTIDIEASALSPEQLREAERRVNEIVFENRPVTISYHDASDDSLGLRKASERSGILRVVSIEGVDRSACGGTHVRSTAEIGPVQIRRLDKIRQTIRVEFICGWRTVRRARADFDALSRVARVFSSSIDDAPGMVEAQRERLLETDKRAKSVATQFAMMLGTQLYQNIEPNRAGVRVGIRIVADTLGDELRTEAQYFTKGEKAVFIGIVQEPPTVLLAISPDIKEQAGAVLKPMLTTVGGRGGGSAQMAQGSVPTREAAQAIMVVLTSHFA
ncbi:MAG: hypothetical protein IT168_25850 [Bryobacterales bacterium]|nr:hypothetical protein [Bryobacterales bacterium]